MPPAYLLLSPVCRLLDAVTLLGTTQHYALLCTVVIAVVAWRARRAARGLPCRASREVAILLGVVPAAILGVYALCLLPPRPALALRVADPDVVVVDFHSHTNFSWDGRGSFTVQRNRDWHRAGGWNVAYITDHTRLEGAALGIAENPRRAGDGTILLAAVETRRTHLVVLGMTPDDWQTLRDDNSESRVRYSPQHLVIQTIPSDLESIAHPENGRIGPLVAIELSDGDPRGLDQEQRDRAALLEIADRRGLAVVASSNNHGWTSPPAAWSLLRIAGWRDLTPEALDLEIQDRLRGESRRAVRVVERYATDVNATAAGLAATVPLVVWHVLATLTPGERLSWLVWTWGSWLAIACVVRMSSAGGLWSPQSKPGSGEPAG